MTGRRRTLLFLCALVLGASLAPSAVASARPAQDPGASFGGAGATTTTTAAATSTTEATAETNSTLVESEDSPDQPLFTENRKVAAVIGGLVLVAFALLLLTIRYIRVTKPSSSDDVDPAIPMLPIDLDINDESIFVDDSLGLAPPRKAIDPTGPNEPAALEEPEGATGGHDGDDAGAGDDADGVVAAAAAAEPTRPAPEAPSADDATVVAIAASPGTDHDAADDDWEPHTDEHQRVEIPGGTSLSRPGAAARRKALGVDPG